MFDKCQIKGVANQTSIVSSAALEVVSVLT